MIPVCEPAVAACPALGCSWFTARVQIALASCACAGSAAMLYAVDPGTHGFYPQCLLYRTTGIYCAGCGATRALHALLHGRLLPALHDNALFMIALPVILYVAGAHALAAWTRNAWPEVTWKPRTLVRIGVAALLAMTGFMVLRNLPGWPFDALKPLAG